MKRFSQILRNRDFFLLWLGQIISQLGDRLGQMALIGFIPADAPRSGIQLAKILSFTIIPVFLIGPVAGIYVDRWDRRRTMFVSDSLRCFLTLLIPLFLINRDSLGFIYLLIFFIFSLGRFFVPAKMSIIPELVKKEDLLIGNSLVNTTGMVATVAGFAIGGIVVEYLGPKGGFYLDALSFFISALLIFFISKRNRPRVNFGQVGKQIVDVIRKSLIQEFKEGLLYFLQKKQVRFTGIVMFLLGAACGSIYIVGIVFIRQVLPSDVKDLGFLIMFLGLGLFWGSLIYGRFGQKFSHYKMIFVSLVSSGVMLVIFTSALNHFPSFPVAALLCLALGVCVAPIIIASNTIVHNASDNHMMGKTFSALEIMMHLGFFIFMFVSSWYAEKFSAGLVLFAVGILFSLIGILSLIYHRRIPWLD